MLAFREKSKKWEGPRILSRAREKTARALSNQDKKERLFPVTHIKELQAPKLGDELYLTCYLCELEKKLSSVSAQDQKFNQPTPGSDNARFLEVSELNEKPSTTAPPESTSVESICLTRIAQSDSLTIEQQKLIDEAISQEVGGVFAFDALEKLDESDLPESANALDSRFALAIKSEHEASETSKARLVAQGRLGAEKEKIVRDAPTAMNRSVRATLTLASVFHFRACARDVKQAYLESQHNLGRDLCARLPKSAKLPNDALHKIIKPMRRIIESGSLWIDAYLWAFHNDLKMKATALGPCFLLKSPDVAPEGFAPVIADDTWCAGAKEFKGQEEQAVSKLKTFKRDESEMNFAGLAVARNQGAISARQQKRIDKLPDEVSKEMGYGEFSALRGKLSWIAQRASQRRRARRIWADLMRY